MKNQVGWAVAVLLLLQACSPPVVFTEAQPDVVPEQKVFLPAYQGLYFCTGDSAIVRIAPTVISKERRIQLNTTTKDIEETDGVYLDGDLLYIEETNTPVQIQYLDEERIMVEITLIDTLFQIGGKQVLKLYRGHQILNTKMSRQNWDVQILSKDEDGNLSLWKTKLPEDLEGLEAITPVEDISTEDVVRYRISPNIAEFRKLMDSKLIFEACEYFERIDESM